MIEYERILVEHDPETGGYTVDDYIIGAGLGEVVHHDGPGWVFYSTGVRPFEYDSLTSILKLLNDLNGRTGE